MKKNKIESCQKCLLVKNNTNNTKKSFARWFNQKKAWRGVLKIDACAAAKHRVILSWTYNMFYLNCLSIWTSILLLDIN